LREAFGGKPETAEANAPCKRVYEIVDDGQAYVSSGVICVK